MHQSTVLERQQVPKVSTWAPPRWLNRIMIWLLRAPLLERWIGQELALISFKGRKTGKLYTTPVTYLRQDDEVIIVTKHFRLWWRNLRDNPRTILRLAGRDIPGIVTVMPTGDEAQATMIRFLENRRRDARAYGLQFDESGKLDPVQVRSLLPQIVVLRVTLMPDHEAKAFRSS